MNRYQSQFVDPEREKRFQQRIEELESVVHQRSKKYSFSTIPPKSDRQRERDLIRNIKKNYLYETAARELIGFKFENHAAWVIEQYGNPREVVTQETLATQRSVRHFAIGTGSTVAQLGQNTAYGVNKLTVKVMASALNIDDYHVAKDRGSFFYKLVSLKYKITAQKGWCANYNLWKRDGLEAINKAWMRVRGRPDNVKTESTHGMWTDSGSEFPITLGREFSGVIIDAPHPLEYDFPIGMKVIGYLPPHQKGCLAEVVSLPVIQCSGFKM